MDEIDMSHINSVGKLMDVSKEFEAKKKRQQEVESATIQTAKNTYEIKSQVDGIRRELESERKERIDSDKENMNYTKKMDKRNFVISLSSIAISVGSIVVALLLHFLSVA